jgi:Tfp pilus assembly protein PilV
LKLRHKMKNKGQTLIETILASSVITIGLIAILSLVVSSIGASADSKERTQAAFVAQEYIEKVKNIRDSNLKAVNPWNNNIYTNDGYYLYNNGATPSLTFLGSDKDGNVAGPNADLDGISFTPYLQITQYGGSADEYQVTVEVDWRESSIKTSTILSGWKQ